MNIKLSMASIIAASLLLTACGEKSSEAKSVEVKPAMAKEEKISELEKELPKVQKKEQVVYGTYDSIVNEVFKDTAKIAPDGQQMLLIFGTNTDPYSDRLKADITNSPDLQKRIKTQFSSYYLRAHENLKHKQFHEGELMDVDTKTMIMIYGIEATPTIIFCDDKGKAVIVVPGYMPTEQFLVTMDFMQSKKYEGKDRKNGEVYEALRDFYIANGINVIKKEAKS